MTSPLVQRLLTEIEAEIDGDARACLCAELACYWARVGEFEKAEDLRARLRRDFGDGNHVRVSIWIMCIEALLLYFKDLNQDARDRMARAKLLSVAAKDRRLIAITSAWMAHIDFNQNRFESMVRSASTSLASIDTDNHLAECRVSIVLGDALLYCRQPERSAAWYARGHAAATKLGDHAAIGALTYNKAALRVANARLQSIETALSESELALIRAEVNSAVNYQRIAQLLSLDHLLGSTRVGIMLLQKQFGEAQVIIDELLESSQLSVQSAQSLLLQADKILCIANQGRGAEVIRLLQSLPMEHVSTLPADDKALVFSSLFRAAGLCDVKDTSETYRSEMCHAISKHSLTIRTLTELLAEFDRQYE